MYKLQWAFIKDENGIDIPVDKFEFHDTVFEYENEQDAMEDRIVMQMKCNDKYIRIKKE